MKRTKTDQPYKYALFRSDTLITTIDHALRGEVYDTPEEAVKAKEELVSTLAKQQKILIEVRQLPLGEYDEEIEPNAWARYYPA